MKKFAAHVAQGLTKSPKRLSSSYLYDEQGDLLFQEIMLLPEYYLSRKEAEILEQNKKKIVEIFASSTGFDLIELGAGNGEKTKILLRQLQQEHLDFRYLPVDISANVLQQLKKELQDSFPDLEIAPKQGAYDEVLHKLAKYNTRKKVILFLGSNLGNFNSEEGTSFLQKISKSLQQKDLLFLGVDQKKDPRQILAAYNDTAGVTAAFAKNLLQRINVELDADFNLDLFLHWPSYDPQSGMLTSYLVSSQAQVVQIKALGLEVRFKEWETIHTEISMKYDDETLGHMAANANLEIVDVFTDSEKYFKNYILMNPESTGL